MRRRRRAPIPALRALPGLLTLLSVTTLTPACDGGSGGDDAFPVTRVDSAGVEIVTSGAEQRPLEWSFTEAFALGGEDEGPGSFFRLYPGLLATDAAGRIHVLDGMSHRVVTFDGDGAFVREVGQEGGGPGELQRPASLGVGPGGELAVFDYGKAALVRWDSAGELLPERRFPLYPVSGGRFFALTTEGYVVATGGQIGDERVNRLIAVAGEDTTLLAAAPQPDQGYVQFERCGGGINFPPLFTPSLVWDHRNGTTVVAPGDDYRIDVWRDGRLVRSIRRPLPEIHATRELAIAEAGDGFTIDFGRGPCTVPPGEYADARGWAATVPAIRRLALAPDGSLWVERWAPGADPMPIDRFDGHGAYLGTLREGAAFPALFLDDGRLGVIRVDELDVARLVVGEGAGGAGPP